MSKIRFDPQYETVIELHGGQSARTGENGNQYSDEVSSA